MSDEDPRPPDSVATQAASADAEALPRVFLIYQPTDETLLKLVKAAAKGKFQLELCEDYIATQPKGNWWSRVRNVISQEGDKFQLVVGLMLPDERNAPERGNGWIEMGTWLGCHGDHRLLLLHDPNVSPPVYLAGAQSLLNSCSNGASKSAVADEIVDRIQHRLNQSDESPPAELRVLLIEHGRTFWDSNTAGAEDWQYRLLVSGLLSELAGHTISTRGKQELSISVDVLSRLMALEARESECPGSAPHSLLRLKTIINRFDFVLYFVGPGTTAAHDTGMGPLALGYWLGRGQVVGPKKVSDDDPDCLVISCYTPAQLPSNFHGIDVAVIPADFETLASSGAMAKVLDKIGKLVRSWEDAVPPSKSGSCIHFLRKFSAFAQMQFADLSEAGNASASYPNDLLAPTMAIVCAVERLAKDMRQIWEAIQAIEAWTDQFSFLPGVDENGTMRSLHPSDPNMQLIAGLVPYTEAIRDAISQLRADDCIRRCNVDSTSLRGYESKLRDYDRLAIDLTNRLSEATTYIGSSHAVDELRNSLNGFTRCAKQLKAIFLHALESLAEKQRTLPRFHERPKRRSSLLRDARESAEQRIVL